MKRKLYAGTTSLKLRIFVQNSSTGGPLTGLAWNAASLTWYYIRNGANADTQVTLAAGTLGTWSSGGFIVVDATGMPGVYEIGVPNAAIVTGADTVHMMLQGATNMTPVLIEIELDKVNYQSYNQFQQIDLPTFSANAASLLIRDYLVSTGVTSPVTADLYYVAGIYSTNNIPYYVGSVTGNYIWTDSTYWYISSTAPGVSLPTAYFRTASSATAIGPYTAQGTATGTPAVAGHGNAILAAFQPETVNLTGSLSGSVGSVTGNVGGNVAGSVASVTGAVGSVTGLTTATIATAVWTDTADLTTSGTPGYILKTQLSGAFTSATSSVFSTASLVNAPSGGGGFSLTTTMNTPRNLSAVADSALTVNDMLWAAYLAGVGQRAITNSGANETRSTASTGTLLRTWSITTGAPPWGTNVPLSEV